MHSEQLTGTDGNSAGDNICQNWSEYV